jgi:hypothetical protein
MELRFTIILGAAYAVNTWAIGLFCFENRLFSFSRCLGGLCVEDGDFLNAEGAKVTQKTQKKTENKRQNKNPKPKTQASS